ncbi:MAG: methylmalonyl Co-A mutase-associated GTPase MeaB [Flavobacteriales bacterium]|nr:MAG: methylmalonyl Co-A mutase-associated GTPase MeaB [Flavobacteriales bacterium]
MSQKIFSANEYIDGVLACNRAILSQAITLIESSLPEHQQLAEVIIEKCLPHSGNSIRVGITGVPGVGKSTFIESLGKHLTSNKKKLAVLAVDPSSEKNKGSILGDKTRMEQLASDANAYIRPSPSRGSLGGVASATRQAIILCEAAGFDTIFVETVGVGQSETAVHSMVDFFLLLMLAGAGDELQGIKRGVVEMADLFVINKADGDNIEKCKQAKNQLKNALHLFPAKENGWQPKVETCSALTHDGIEKAWQMVEEHRQLTKSNGFFAKNRQQQAKQWMYEAVDDALKKNFYSNSKTKAELQKLEAAVLNGEISAVAAAKQIIP